jgi:hypothetical protein
MNSVRKQVYTTLYGFFGEVVCEEVADQVGNAVPRHVYRMVGEQVRSPVEFQLQEDIRWLED